MCVGIFSFVCMLIWDGGCVCYIQIHGRECIHVKSEETVCYGHHSSCSSTT